MGEDPRRSNLPGEGSSAIIPMVFSALPVGFLEVDSIIFLMNAEDHA
jgi:hypothetical protein